MIRIDARNLEPPRPMELVMEALCDLAPDDEILLILDREPYPLYQILERNGHAWRTRCFDDGHFEIVIRARGAA